MARVRRQSAVRWRALLVSMVVGAVCTPVISDTPTHAGSPTRTDAPAQMQSKDPQAGLGAAVSRLLLRPRTMTETVLTSDRKQSYRILLSVPQGPAPVGGFPVIYVLDGDAWFVMAVQVARMREYETLAPAVIVGIAYPSRYFFDAKRRTLDFTPPHSSDPDMQGDGIQTGGADQFLEFINQVLRPWVRRSCNCTPGTEALFGHSLGGLFVLYAMFHAPESFGVYLAASPTIIFSNRIILHDEPAFERNPRRTAVRLLVTSGEYEYPKESAALMSDYLHYYTAHPEEIPGETPAKAVSELFGAYHSSFSMHDSARDLAHRLAHNGVRATYADFPGEEHTSAAVSALNRGIPFALRPGS